MFLTNNDVSAPVSVDGLVTAGERGEAFVMARFETHTVGSQFIVLPKGLSFTFPAEPEFNYIDKLVNDKLKKLRIAPSGQCDDEAFLRRASIDIVGMPPSLEEFNRFMASTDPAKRSKWIDELLERKEFSEIWVSKWAELLQVRTDPTKNVSQKAMFLYYNWLVDKLSKNMPMDEMVQELLGASGGTFKNAATNFLHDRSPTEIAGVADLKMVSAQRCSWAFAFNAPSATTTRLIAGPKTTTTASRPSSPRLAARGAKTIARRSSLIQAVARSTIRSAAG